MGNRERDYWNWETWVKIIVLSTQMILGGKIRKSFFTLIFSSLPNFLSFVNICSSSKILIFDHFQERTIHILSFYLYLNYILSFYLYLLYLCFMRLMSAYLGHMNEGFLKGVYYIKIISPLLPLSVFFIYICK